MLRQQEQARTSLSASRSKPEPRSQWNLPDKLNRRASEVQHNCAEPASLQQKIRCAKSAVKDRPSARLGFRVKQWSFLYVEPNSFNCTLLRPSA
jgi:hypothetical protein